MLHDRGAVAVRFRVGLIFGEGPQQIIKRGLRGAVLCPVVGFIGARPHDAIIRADGIREGGDFGD